MAADAYDIEQAGRTLQDSATVVSAKRRLEPLLDAVARDPFNARARRQLRAFLGGPLTVASNAWVRLQAADGPDTGRADHTAAPTGKRAALPTHLAVVAKDDQQ